MGVQNALCTIIDQPDLVHGVVGRMTDGYLSMLDQLQEQGLLGASKKAALPGGVRTAGPNSQAIAARRLPLTGLAVLPGFGGGSEAGRNAELQTWRSN